MKTAAIRSEVDSLEHLLINRKRNLADRRSEVKAGFASGGPDAVARAFERTLGATGHLDDLATAYAVQYRPEARELLIDCELPRQSVVPRVRAHRFVKTRRSIEPEPRKDAEVKTLYELVLARVVLRVLAEAFDASPTVLVSSIALNGPRVREGPSYRQGHPAMPHQRQRGARGFRWYRARRA